MSCFYCFNSSSSSFLLFFPLLLLLILLFSILRPRQSWTTSAHVHRRERSGIKTSIVCKRISKHPHILAIFRVDSEYLRVLFKAKVDYFILYSILVSTFVNYFFYYFLWTKHERSREQFFHSNVYMFKRIKQKSKTYRQHVISSKKLFVYLISVSALKVHFDIHLHFS